jgi:hypothetical protein
VAERREAEQKRETRTQVRQHAVENGNRARIHGNLLAGRRRGVGRSAHPDRG